MYMPRLSGRMLHFPSDFLSAAQHSTVWMGHNLFCPGLLGWLVPFQPPTTADLQQMTL